MTDIIGELEHGLESLVKDAEELFPPKPGGLVDQWRKRKAEAEAAAAREAEDATGVVEELGRRQVRAVRTIAEPANLGNALCVLLSSTAPVARLLPRDSARRSAVILAVDNDVYITSDPGTASNMAGGTTGTAGFYLPAKIPVPVASTAEWYAAATTTASTSRVSVLIFRDSA